MIWIVRKRRHFANGSDKKGRHFSCTMAYEDDLRHLEKPSIWNYKSNTRKFLTSRIIPGAVKSRYELTKLELTMFGGKHQSSSDLSVVCVRLTLSQCQTYPGPVSYLPWVCVRLTLSLGETYPEFKSVLPWVCVILTQGLCQTYPEFESDLPWVSVILTLGLCHTYPDSVSHLTWIFVKLTLRRF